jgi:hypothetical protein
MRRLITITVAVEIDESSFGVDPVEAALDVAHMEDVDLPDIAKHVGYEAERLLAFHADGVRVADTRAVMTEAYDPALEPF